MHHSSPVRWCGRVQDAVHHRIAQVHVGRGHIDLGAQHAGAFGEFARSHPAQQIEVFLDGAVAVRAVFARFGQRAAILANLVGAQVIDVGQPFFDQLFGPFVDLLEVVGGVEELCSPSRSRASGRLRSMALTYSSSSLAGLVSSKRRLHLPP